MKNTFLKGFLLPNQNFLKANGLVLCHYLFSAFLFLQVPHPKQAVNISVTASGRRWEAVQGRAHVVGLLWAQQLVLGKQWGFWEVGGVSEVLVGLGMRAFQSQESWWWKWELVPGLGWAWQWDVKRHWHRADGSDVVVPGCDSLCHVLLRQRRSGVVPAHQVPLQLGSAP